jgi:hypothetical protein
MEQHAEGYDREEFVTTAPQVLMGAAAVELQSDGLPRGAVGAWKGA